MGRRKSVTVPVVDNVNLEFLQRRYVQLLGERACEAVPSPSNELETLRDLMGIAEEKNSALQEELDSVRRERDTLKAERDELKEQLASEEERNSELIVACDERFDLLCHAQKALRSVLGREDSVEKFEAFRVLEDITDEVG